jgi:hypothetical protein
MRWVTPIALTASLFLIYVYNQAAGGERISYRYAAPVIPSLILVGALCVDRLYFYLSKGQGVRRVLVVGIPLIILLPNIGLDVLHLPFLKRSHAYVEDVCVRYGTYLHDHCQEMQTVACYDVGAIGYYGKIHVFDMLALVSPETFPIRVNAQTIDNVDALNSFKPDYFVLPWLGNPEKILRVLPPHDFIFQDSVYSYRMSWSLDNTPRVTGLLRLHWR